MVENTFALKSWNFGIWSLKMALIPRINRVYRRVLLNIFFVIFCFCNRASGYLRVKKNQLHALFIFSIFRQTTSTCFGRIYNPSSGGTTVRIQQLVLISLFRRLSVVLVGLEQFQPNQENRQSSKKNSRYQLQYIPYPTAFPYGNGMVLHFYQQQESSTTKTVHKVINKGLKTYV